MKPDKSSIVRIDDDQSYLQLAGLCLEHAGDMVLWIGPDARLLYVNDAACRTLEYSRDELLQMTIHDVDPNYPADTWTEKWKKLKTLGSVTVESIHRTKSGREIPVQIKGNYVRCNNQEYNFAFARDVSDLKKAQRELLEANKQTEHINRHLEASIKHANLLARPACGSNQAKSEFLASMSHEIRTPLHAIIGFSDILAQENISPDQKNYVDLITTAGRSLLGLINDILDFSKIEAGKIQLEIVECSLEKILNEVEALLRPAARSKNLQLEILPEKNLPACLRTDPARLRQCLVNLVNNAVKFTQQGYVRIRVSLTKHRGADALRFDVEDTGIGIAPEDQQKIFDVFAQADESTTRKYGGTGLGLAITRQLTLNLGGEISLVSQPGQGSTFTLIIPAGLDVNKQPRLTDYQEYQPKKEPAENKLLGPLDGHILVAEDNPSNQILMNKLLTRMGLRVTLAHDGQQALEKYAAGRFDLILMDMQMPRMNGYEAAAALRRRGHCVPIIAMTASAMKGDREKCIRAGCDDYLAKPIDSQELRKSMENNLNSHPSATPPTSNHHSAPADQSAQDSAPLVSELTDDPDLCVVAEIFVQEFPDAMEQITAAARRKDYEQLKFLIHSLKGASGSAGYPAVMEKTLALEKQVLAQELEDLQAGLDELNRLCQRVAVKPDA